MTRHTTIDTKDKCVIDEEYNAIVYWVHPNELPEGMSFPLSFAAILRDGREGDKLKFLELAEEALTQLYKMKGPVISFTEILCAIVEDRGIHEFEYGVFFLLYSRFQKEFEIADGGEQPNTDGEMKALIGNCGKLLKRYKHKGEEREVSLPVYIRNAIVHYGTNPSNRFSAEELKAAIEFLRVQIELRQLKRGTLRLKPLGKATMS